MSAEGRGARPLEDIRTEIDAIDAQVRELIMRRMDCSAQVAAAKLAAGSTEVFRPDREASMLDHHGALVPKERRAGYRAALRRVVEASRSYQYGIMYAQLGDAATCGQLSGAELLEGKGQLVELELGCPGTAASLATLLGMVAEHGVGLAGIEQLSTAGGAGESAVRYRLTLAADAADPALRKLLWQLSKESLDLRITAVR